MADLVAKTDRLAKESKTAGATAAGAHAEAAHRGPTLRDVAMSLVARHAPGGELLSVKELGVDTMTEGATLKAVGYGRPIRLDVRLATGEQVRWVLHTATPNAFGHDRRADRVAEMVLAYDTFKLVPAHTRALDVGLITDAGTLVSICDTHEAFLVTTWAEGHIYAEELRAIAARGRATEDDVAHAQKLGRYLATLHEPIEQEHGYVRSVRDLVGSGEGIFGIIDGYPPNVQGAPPARLQALEQKCVAWRWRLKHRDDRLVRVHGDFHPFNVLFDDESTLSVLDASRGCAGDAADDLMALSVNYLFFALQSGTWANTFQPLWEMFFSTYLAHRPDPDVIALAPPFLAWRALVLSNPAWYPDLDPQVRDALLGLAERALSVERFTLAHAEELFS